MVLPPAHRDPPPTAARTWRPWRSAWADAAYGPGGFWTHERPADHFATAVGAGVLVATAVAALAHRAQVVVDVGAGDGRLLEGLADLLPGVDLVGVDRRSRPPGLPDRVRWCVDHADVRRGGWVAGGPETWCGATTTPLLVAHEWLDDLPAPVVARPDGTAAGGTAALAGGWREVEVDGGGRERPGGPVDPADADWLARWWPVGGRAEVGRPRDVAWAGLVGAAVRRGGWALAVDYGHLVEDRPAGGSLAAYGGGRRRAPVPDGSVNLTAAVAVDALAAAGRAAGAVTTVLERQSAVLARSADAAGGPGSPSDPLANLVRRSERAALTARHRWGHLWWLLQGAGDAAPDPLSPGRVSP